VDSLPLSRHRRAFIDMPQWLEFLALGAGLCPGPTERLALAVDHGLIAERVFVIVTTYIDEAGTHGAAPHMIMGALVGRLGQWAYFDKKWRKMLRRNGIAYFHSKEWKHNQGPFKGWDHAKKAALIERASDIQRDTTLFGLTVKIQEADYDLHYKSGERPKKIPLDSMYGLCFRHVVVFVVDTLAKALNRSDIAVNFVVEAGHKNDGDLARIFNQMKSDKSGRPVALGSLILGAKKEFYGLQGADLVSHTFYLAERENEQEMQLTALPEDGTLADAEKLLKRKGPIYRNVLGPDQLRHIKASKFAWEKERMEFWKRGQGEQSRPGDASASVAQSS
jgi:hypothetical protein